MQRIVRNAFRLCLVLAAMACASSAHADSFSSSKERGYVRLLFTLAADDKVTAQVIDQVLTISFSRKPAISSKAVVQAFPVLLASAREDADGATFRFALTQPVRVHTSSSGNRFAVDLMPRSYAGTPPDLPPPVKVVKAVDPSDLMALKVRLSLSRKRTRLIFDWPSKVSYAAYPGAGKLTVRFEAQANLDFSAINKQAPPWLKTAGWHIENKGTVVELVTDPASSFRNFRDGTHVVIDVLAPKTDADALGAADSEAKETGSAQAIMEAAAKLNGQTPAKAPASDEQQTFPASLVAQLPDPAAITPPAEGPTADSRLTRDGAVLTFPGAGRRGSAVFVRGLTAWIILQDAPRLDAAKLKAQLGDFPEAIDAASTNDSTQLRITLKQPAQIAAFSEGSTLKVVIAPHVNATALAIGFARNQDLPGYASISTLLPGATPPMKLIDPDAGDELIVIPGAAGRKMSSERSYTEFAALETASGIVLLPYIDDLKVAINGTRVTITRPGGLSLTPAAMTASGTPEALASSGNGPCFLNFPEWRKVTGGTFLATERRLRAAVSRLSPKAAGKARLKLAQFYLANGFAAEALGIINGMQTEDPSLQSDMQLQTMRAAANLQMGRYREAHNDLAGAQFDRDRHAALWRGLTEAALENWAEARKNLERALPVLDAYETNFRARVRLAAAETALGLGRLEIADAQIQALPKKLDKSLMLQAALDRARLYAAERRQRDADRLFALVETSGNERQASEAVYYRVTAGLASGSMKPAKAVNALERLRFRWRGDTLELKTLRALASIYFAQKKWRQGLQTLRIATESYPTDDVAGKAQDDMRAAFVDLFLNGKADGIPPVAALAIFYDFIELTPIGPEGDEMIRRMSERLVAVDLLGPAEGLLEYQITKRLDGVARAQVATRLAMVQLMDHKPEAVLETLRSTQISTLPDEVAHQRLLMQARALSELKQWDQALDFISADPAPDTARLRADIYWQSSDWTKAAQAAEDSLNNRWNDPAPLNDIERQTVMRAAVAFSLGNDQTGLERLRTHFGPKMQLTRDAGAFAVVTQRIDLHGVAFHDAASKIASIDTLKSFMKELQTRAN